MWGVWCRTLKFEAGTQLRARKIDVDHCQAKKGEKTEKLCFAKPFKIIQVWIPRGTSGLTFILDTRKGPIPEALGQLPFVKLQLLGDAAGQGGRAKIYDLRNNTERYGEDIYIYIERERDV